MQTNHRTIQKLAGLTCLALLTGSAGAITASIGDLVLGFRASSPVGNDRNLEVNLGPVANYRGLPANTTFIVTRLNVLDLVATYGGSWDTRNDLTFGIVGAIGNATLVTPGGNLPARSLWASRNEDTPGTTSTPWTRGSASNQQNTSSAIETMYGVSVGALPQGSATSNSTFSTVIDSSLAGSWSVQEDAPNGTQSFRRFDSSFRGTAGSIPSTGTLYDPLEGFAAVDVWELLAGSPQQPGTLLGTFGLNDNGQLVFSNNPGVFAPIPEPSAALVLAGTGAALLLRRRRRA